MMLYPVDTARFCELFYSSSHENSETSEYGAVTDVWLPVSCVDVCVVTQTTHMALFEREAAARSARLCAVCLQEKPFYF